MRGPPISTLEKGAVTNSKHSWRLERHVFLYRVFCLGGQGGGVVDWGQLGGSLVWEELPWHISTGTIDSLVSSRGLNK